MHFSTATKIHVSKTYHLKRGGGSITLNFSNRVWIELRTLTTCNVLKALLIYIQKGILISCLADTSQTTRDLVKLSYLFSVGHNSLKISQSSSLKHYGNQQRAQIDHRLGSFEQRFTLRPNRAKKDWAKKRITINRTEVYIIPSISKLKHLVEKNCTKCLRKNIEKVLGWSRCWQPLITTLHSNECKGEFPAGTTRHGDLRPPPTSAWWFTPSSIFPLEKQV